VPADHPAAVTIPGCVDGMETLIRELGRLDLADVLAPAIDLARDGFEVSTEQAKAFAVQAAIYSENEAVSDFYPEGASVELGATVSRPDLARTLAEVAEDGRAAFYGGRAGEDIVEATSGLIGLEDMTLRQAEWVEPLGTTVAGLTSWTFPPNSQGYLGPAALAVFEILDPPEDANDPLWWHLLIEAYRSVSWERNDLVSDPRTLALAGGFLLDPERLARAAASVDPERAGVWPARLGPTSGTAYLGVADDDGMAVSMIQSNYHGTGSPFGARRSGFLLQDRGTGFNLMPGHPNELSPGKRPLHTLSPTLWTEAGRPRWILGTRGGSLQPQMIAQVAARAILGNAALHEAQAAPRWAVTEFGPGSPPHPSVEPGAPPKVLVGLERKGHHVTVRPTPQPGWGPLSIIELDGEIRRAAPDPRVDTTAALIF
jgi:gamma-glutamyltranspeptidase/glutathione hydrolase